MAVMVLLNVFFPCSQCTRANLRGRAGLEGSVFRAPVEQDALHSVVKEADDGAAGVGLLSDDLL